MGRDRLFLKWTAAIAAVCGVAAIEFILAAEIHRSGFRVPFPLGWLLVPFLIGALGYTSAPIAADWVAPRIVTHAKPIRMAVGALAAWTIVVFGLFYIVSPSDDLVELRDVFRIWAATPVLAAVVFGIWKWAISG